MVEKLVQMAGVQEMKRLQLHVRAMEVAADYRRCEADLFQIVSMIEEKKVYLDLEIPSLFQYAVEMLKLSRHFAYDLITVVRKAREIPEIKTAVLHEQVSISKARRICAVVSDTTADEWIEIARSRANRELEKAVAAVKPREAITERMTFVAADTLQFQLAVSEEWAELLTSVKDLLSQKQGRAISSEEALFRLMSDFKEKHDPVLKAERAQVARLKRDQSVCGLIAPGSSGHCMTDFQESQGEVQRNRKIPAKQIHSVNLRDQGQCAFVDRGGKRCSHKRWLQKHHVVHFAEGGSHSAENLQTLCWAHHAMAHRLGSQPIGAPAEFGDARHVPSSFLSFKSPGSTAALDCIERLFARKQNLE